MGFTSLRVRAKGAFCGCAEQYHSLKAGEVREIDVSYAK
jgi:hypothetical protein